MYHMFNSEMNPTTSPEHLAKLTQYPFAAIWKKAFFDLPIALLSQSLRVSARRLEAELEYLDTVTYCKTMPEMVEAHSHLIQKTTSDIGQETSRFLQEMGTKIRNDLA